MLPRRPFAACAGSHRRRVARARCPGVQGPVDPVQRSHRVARRGCARVRQAGRAPHGRRFAGGRVHEGLTPAGPRWGTLGRVTATAGGAMSDTSEIHLVPEEFAARAGIGHRDYERLYAESVRDPDAFWARAAERLDWDRKPTRIREVSYD